MKLKAGDKVRIKSHYIHYKSLGDKHPRQGSDIKEAIIVRSAKGTEYRDSDWIVCKPNTPGWQYGIKEEQIIEVKE